jgi:outer membrane protein assembly factor BamE (lipoprotein component of BamABCDE complex)
MRAGRAGLIGGMALLALAGCSMNLQTVTQPSEIGERRLTVGTVQREIHKGMAAAAVAEALGAPNIVTTDEQGREVWIYDRIATERVYMDESGHAGLVLMGYARQGGAATLSQRTLTVIVKFDGEKRVREYAYHASRF